MLYYLAHGTWGSLLLIRPFHGIAAGQAVGVGVRSTEGRVVEIQTLTSDSQACPGLWSPPDILSPWHRCKAPRDIGLGQHASEEARGSQGIFS